MAHGGTVVMKRLKLESWCSGVVVKDILNIITMAMSKHFDEGPGIVEVYRGTSFTVNVYSRKYLEVNSNGLVPFFAHLPHLPGP